MARVFGLILLLGSSAAGLWAQQQQPHAQEPPEEDEALAEKTYAFNPLQAEKELKVGNFYFKKGSYKAAAGRFREASKWNPGLAEAWFRLGEAEEKLKHAKEAREAYGKFLDLAPEDKRAAELRKKLGKELPPGATERTGQ